MQLLPVVHFAVDEVPICGAIVPSEQEQTPHLPAVNCVTCLDTLRALKPLVHGLPLDVTHEAVLFVSHQTLRISTPCLKVEHKWVFAGRQHWRLWVEDAEGHALGAKHGLLIEVGVRLPETLDDYLYHMDQRTSWQALITVGRTRGGSAPRCVDIQGSVAENTMTVRSFIADTDPRTDEVHLSNKIGEYARHMLSR